MKRIALLCLIVALTIAPQARASTYPEGVVTIIVPYAAGTATDTNARLVSRLLEKDLGQKFIVENRPGANGMTGAEVASRAKPDGYTLLFTTNSTHTSVQGLYKNVPYDPVKNFTPVSILYAGATMLAVRPDMGIRTLDELIAYAKANPGKLNVGTANASGQIAVEVLKKRTAVEVTGVPYRGTPQALADLLGGSIQLMVGDVPTLRDQIAAGKVTPLAFFSTKRNPLYPDVVTYHETIAPGVDLSLWTAVFAPPGLPKPVLDKLAVALRKSIESPEFTELIARSGGLANIVGPDEFAAKLPEDISRWNAMIKEAQISPE